MKVYETDHSNSREVCRAFAEGAQLESRHITEYESGPSVVYGILRGCGEIIRDCQKRGHSFIHIDRGYYFGFRVTLNAFQAYEYLDVDASRSPELEPWQNQHGKTLIAPPSNIHAAFRGIDRKKWILDRKSRYPDHIMWEKGRDVDWNEIGFVSAFNSMIAVGAVMRGIPAEQDDGLLKSGHFDREKWINTISWSQWSIEELQSGVCWEALKKHHE